jgi:deoxyribodipyrimidine photo-lyase
LHELHHFLEHAAADYPEGRNRPAVTGTSRLSPHLHFGEISPVQVYHAVRHAEDAGEVPQAAVKTFLSEIGWREFSYHLLASSPDIARTGIRRSFDAFPWRDDKPGFRAWTRGETGYPLVDAGMRQLWQTGWMHNRIRMVTASFLIKHLLIDWRDGEAWFWDTLVDADPANNPVNWQWVAGCGADASPFFRIFNPTSQGQKFDPDGAYVRRFVPELARLPSKHIHEPSQAPHDVLAEAGVTLGKTYPHPIVDHAAARRRALDAFRSLKPA